MTEKIPRGRAITSWTCSQCSTKNSRPGKRVCMVCGAVQAVVPAEAGPDAEVSAEAGEATSATLALSSASSTSALSPSAPPPALPPSSARPVSPASPVLPEVASASRPSASSASPSARVGPGAGAIAAPRVLGRGLREFAVGKLLGVGHVALWVYAIYAATWHFGWGRSVLVAARQITVPWAAVAGSPAASMQTSGIVQGSLGWVRHLPWGQSASAYFTLAIALLIVRFWRRLPGWLSIIVALPAAVYGLIRAISYFPSLAIYWPLSLLALIAAWIVVAKTLRRS